MLKYTKYTLKKIESIFEAIDYQIRYEKGNFQSGYCIVKNKRIAIINKFYDTEGRMNCLLDILSTLEIDATTLDADIAVFYKKVNTFIKSLSSDKDLDKST